MSKVTSCGIVPIRKNGDKTEILLGQPTNGGFYGMGFLKGQVEDGETEMEAAIREFAEESGNLDVELFDINTSFIQDNPKKKIYIWPAKVPHTDNNTLKINEDGVILEHDHENELVQFYDIEDLPMVFRNQQEILEELLVFIENNEAEII